MDERTLFAGVRTVRVGGWGLIKATRRGRNTDRMRACNGHQDGKGGWVGLPNQGAQGNHYVHKDGKGGWVGTKSGAARIFFWEISQVI